MNNSKEENNRSKGLGDVVGECLAMTLLKDLFGKTIKNGRINEEINKERSHKIGGVKWIVLYPSIKDSGITHPRKDGIDV